MEKAAQLNQSNEALAAATQQLANYLRALLAVHGKLAPFHDNITSVVIEGIPHLPNANYSWLLAAAPNADLNFAGQEISLKLWDREGDDPMWYADIYPSGHDNQLVFDATPNPENEDNPPAADVSVILDSLGKLLFLGAEQAGLSLSPAFHEYTFESEVTS